MFSLAPSLEYLQLGFTHVVPLGLDHILFIVTLFLPCKTLRAIIIQCSIFTIAHSISLALATLNIVSISAKIIEPLIALTILIAAIQNLLQSRNDKSKLALIFIFGLIHGMGFANALKDLLANQHHLLNALLFFNIGVELGQISVIFICYFGIKKWFGHKDWYQQKVIYPLSSIIACIAVYWLITRILVTT
ncbi:MAG: hypothetical protein RLY16_322 [Bacteroidota bacterium]